MSVKCYFCENHKLKGNKHTCTKCENKEIYGTMRDQFIDCCLYFKMTPQEAKRRAFIRKLEKLPIDDRLIGIKERREK